MDTMKNVKIFGILTSIATIMTIVFSFGVAQNVAAESDGYYDFVIIGNGYTTDEMPRFQNNAQSVAEYLLTLDPFGSRASQLRFYPVENTDDLECVHNETTRKINCNITKVNSRVSAAGVPMDVILVLHDSSLYGGGSVIGAGIAVANSGDTMEKTAVHELGHAGFRLIDEYVVYNYDAALNSIPYFNCYPGEPPASQWVGLDVEYHSGCLYRNWYRSSSTSIMRTLDGDEFNEVSRQIINSVLDEAISVAEATTTPVPTPTIIGPTPTPAATCHPRDFGLAEGQFIGSLPYDDDIDVFIINDYCFKRLFLDPKVLGFYGHLADAFANVRHIQPSVKETFQTSGLFRVCEPPYDPKVYALEITGEDTASIHHVQIDGNVVVDQDPAFFLKVFCINRLEFNYMNKSSTPYTRLEDIPVYSR